jgi:formate dehydrogenase alpha subunit
VAGLAATFGSGAMTNPLKDVLKSKVILITGTNTTANHPIIANYIHEAVMKNGAKLIVVDPRRIKLVDICHLWLRPKVGTNVAWLNGLMNVIINENLQDQEYINQRTTGYEELKKTVSKYSPDHVADITGIPTKDLVAAARLYATEKPGSILYAMGITQHTSGVNNVKCIASLAMLCGNVGIEGGGVNPLRGQNNVQGSCDMGGLPNVFTGYQAVTDSTVRDKFAKAWKVSALPEKAGLTVTEMTALDGPIKALYIMGENPMLSEADIHHVEKKLSSLDFLVVQDIFLTETAKLADVVLPSACFAEKDGTFTNTERKVLRVRKALDAIGESIGDHQIISGIAKRMGYEMDYSNSSSVMDEINRLTPSYGGITYDRIENEGGLAWPCPTLDHPGSPILHTQRFTRGEGVFFPIEYQPSAELPDAEYPFVLTTGRVHAHYHTGTMTRKGNALNRICPEALAEINVEDAKSLKVVDGEYVNIVSRRGAIRIKTLVSEITDHGVVFVPFHFYESAVNNLTNCALDPVSKIPELKICAVKIVKAA